MWRGVNVNVEFTRPCSLSTCAYLLCSFLLQAYSNAPLTSGESTIYTRNFGFWLRIPFQKYTWARISSFRSTLLILSAPLLSLVVVYLVTIICFEEAGGRQRKTIFSVFCRRAWIIVLDHWIGKILGGYFSDFRFCWKINNIRPCKWDFEAKRVSGGRRFYILGFANGKNQKNGSAFWAVYILWIISKPQCSAIRLVFAEILQKSRTFFIFSLLAKYMKYFKLCATKKFRILNNEWILFFQNTWILDCFDGIYLRKFSSGSSLKIDNWKLWSLSFFFQYVLRNSWLLFKQICIVNNKYNIQYIVMK